MAVSESTSGSIALIDTSTHQLLRRFSSHGVHPESVVDTGRQILVVNRFDGLVAALNPETGAVTARVSLRGEPGEIVVHPNGRRAFVTVSQREEVVELALPSLKPVRRLSVGRRPRALSLSPDGSVLAVAAFQGGDVSLVRTASFTEFRRVTLTGVNIRGVTITPDGTRAFLSGQIPANSRATVEPLDIWTNTIFTVDIRPTTTGRGAASAEGWIDFSGAPAPDPDGIAALGPDRVAIVLSGSDEVAVVQTPGPYLRTFDPRFLLRGKVGILPRGLALSPDRRQIWVADELGSTVRVLDAATLGSVAQIHLPGTGRPDLRLEGRRIFSSASLTRGGQFSCNSCHPGGLSDGLTWDFRHVRDGVPERNTRALRGGVTLTKPFRWSGLEDDIEVFFQEEVTGLLKGPALPHPPLHALWNMLDQFPQPTSPWRQPDGRLTAQGERGRRLFTGKAGCAGCHAGELAGGTGAKASVGTTQWGLALDVPHLAGVHDSSPYLHDGRAGSLEEIFRRHDPEGRHGRARDLGRGEYQDLMRYLREL